MVQHALPDPPPDREGWDNRGLELLLAFTLPRDGTYVDAGANEGRFLWHSLRHAPAGRHVVWEPLPDLAAHLRRTFPGVEVHEAALSDRAGESEYVVVDDDPGYSGMRERPYPSDFRRHRITVRTERLDDVFEGRLDVVKIDVEGAEVLVLRGAAETLRRERPIVVLEHSANGAAAYDTTPDEVWELLADAVGLRIYDMDGGGPYERAAFNDEAHGGRRWNWVARP